ncbi:U2surp, partial [Symbiodinium sp. CCMP2456]
KICKAQGLNWDVQLSEKAQAMSGRFPEELRKKWLLDRLLTYELYVQETRPAPRGPSVPPVRREVRPDPELDGDPFDRDDEDYAALVSQDTMLP